MSIMSFIRKRKEQMKKLEEPMYRIKEHELEEMKKNKAKLERFEKQNMEYKKTKKELFKLENPMLYKIGSSVKKNFKMKMEERKKRKKPATLDFSKPSKTIKF